MGTKRALVEIGNGKCFRRKCVRERYFKKPDGLNRSSQGLDRSNCRLSTYMLRTLSAS